AVYLKPDEHGAWRWTHQDRELLEAWGDKLRKEGIASDVYLMSGLFAPAGGWKELRLAAARHGADALLVLQGARPGGSYVTPAAVLNLTVVGGYVVPASHRDALFVLQGGLVDVGNGFLYASVEAEGEGRTVGPTFLVEEKVAVERARRQALEAFGPEMLRRL